MVYLKKKKKVYMQLPVQNCGLLLRKWKLWVLFSFWFVISLTILSISFCFFVEFPCCEVGRANLLMGEVWKWLMFKKGCEEKCHPSSMYNYFTKSQFSWCWDQCPTLYAAITDSDFIYKKEKKKQERTKGKRTDNTKQREITAIWTLTL